MGHLRRPSTSAAGSYLRYLVTHGFSYMHLIRTFEMHANALTKVENKSAFYAFQRAFFGM